MKLYLLLIFVVPTLSSVQNCVVPLTLTICAQCACYSTKAVNADGSNSCVVPTLFDLGWQNSDLTYSYLDPYLITLSGGNAITYLSNTPGKYLNHVAFYPSFTIRGQTKNARYRLQYLQIYSTNLSWMPTTGAPQTSSAYYWFFTNPTVVAGKCLVNLAFSIGTSTTVQYINRVGKTSLKVGTPTPFIFQ